MENASELRIGNWITYFGNYGRIESIKKDGCVYLVYGKLEQGNFGNVIEAIEPIPLTPEILEKCGFVKTESKSYRTGKEVVFYAYHKDGLVYNTIQVLWWLFNRVMPNQIKHLHQLQNLYFALTGEELTFKP
jgi:hypothetical protein